MTTETTASSTDTMQRSIIAAVLLLGFIALFALAPARDPSRTLTGTPCSVLSETEIGVVLGAPMRLLPTDGRVCRYISTSGATPKTLVVVARDVPDAPYGWSGNTHANARFVRAGSRSYVLIMPQPGDGAQIADDERRRASVMHPAGMIARNH